MSLPLPPRLLRSVGITDCCLTLEVFLLEDRGLLLPFLLDLLSSLSSSLLFLDLCFFLEGFFGPLSSVSLSVFRSVFPRPFFSFCLVQFPLRSSSACFLVMFPFFSAVSIAIFRSLFDNPLVASLKLCMVLGASFAHWLIAPQTVLASPLPLKLRSWI